MGEVIGSLREDKATFGEKEVLKRLESGLPPDFYVYVECPVPTERIQRFPDFIVVTNFGVVVLEVKDWLQVLEFDRYNVKVFQQGGKHRVEKNPVLTARDIAIALNDQLQKVPELVDGKRQKCSVPWGYAVVFPHLPTPVISQMRSVWGEPHVLNLDDLEPFRLTQSLKATVPRDSTLRREELRYVRAVINPVVVIPAAGARREPASSKPAVILDEVQERLVAEPVKPVQPAPSKSEQAKSKQARQEDLFASLTTGLQEQEEEPREEPFSIEEQISQNLSVRLVRGFAGSGKSLVLQQRARYLAAQYPDWKILALTFNEKPAKKLEKIFRRTGIKASHFHKICKMLLPEEYQNAVIVSPDGWVERWKEKYPIVQQLGSSFVAGEISWIIEMGLESLDAYLHTERKGRGKEGRLNKPEREAVFQVLADYRDYLKEQGQLDWGDIPYLVIQALDQGRVVSPCYDVILIDEAQDFAPSWISVVKRLLKPDQGLLFLADDPMQSIYRYYSWREKGVPVTGRSRWLRVPYRNTREIYQAAYEVIREDEILKAAIETETGLSIEPDLETLRRGPRPRLYRFDRLEHEAGFIRSEIDRLSLLGYEKDDMVVLTRRKNGVKRLQNYLRGSGVAVETFHALKGLEYEVVFISQMQDTFALIDGDQELAQERRLVYMAMTRSRNDLYLCYEGSWPEQLKGVLDHVDRVV